MFFFAHENIKKTLLSKVAHNRPKFVFSVANRPKTSPNLLFLFHKKCSLRDLCIMTLLTIINELHFVQQTDASNVLFELILF